ncbi:Conserved_hypothetical protein [Hexamita inflata]|uniref:Uncharacterized protein n=1 Tax=Hexamita inflata TaxID=28002 RepID=A0AA86UDR4_9EUKA|nr:Conserved hypothetical protein [Hexamita inflata]
MQPQSIFDHQPTERLQFKIDQVLNLSFNSICIKGFFCQTLCYFLIIFVMQQEQYILTSFNGYKFVENFVKIFPIMFLVSYEIPEFFEQYFANKKMATYATGESVQDINRQEFATNCIVAVILLAIPAAQPAIFSALQVDGEYRAMFLLSTVLGIVGPFKSTVYSVFSLKQNYVYIMAGKMVTLMIHFFLFTFIYSFNTRETGFNTWPSGFSKPMAEIIVHVIMLIVLYKGSIFSTKISLEADQTAKISLIPQKKDWKEIGKNILAFLQHLVFYVSRPIVYLFIVYKIINLKIESIKQDAIIDLYVYLFCQQSLSLISKGIHSAIMTIMPILFHQKQYHKMRRLIIYSSLFGLIFNEIINAILIFNPNVIFYLFFGSNNSIISNYKSHQGYIAILSKTALLFGTEVYQTVQITYSHITKKHYVPLIIGLIRITGGVYFVMNLDSCLGQSARYDDVFFYFELLSTIIAAIFTVYMHISMYTEYKMEVKAKIKKIKAKDDFMLK